MKFIAFLFILIFTSTSLKGQESASNNKISYMLGAFYRSPRHIYGKVNLNYNVPGMNRPANYIGKNFSGVGIVGEMRYSQNQLIFYYSSIIRYDDVQFGGLNQNPVRQLIYDQNIGVILDRKMNYGIGLTLMNTFNRIPYLHQQPDEDELRIRIPGLLVSAEKMIKKNMYHLDVIYIGYDKDFIHYAYQSLAIQFKVARMLHFEKGAKNQP